MERKKGKCSIHNVISQDLLASTTGRPGDQEIKGSGDKVKGEWITDAKHEHACTPCLRRSHLAQAGEALQRAGTVTSS